MKKALRIIGLIIISIVAGGILFITVGSIFEGEPISTDFESVGMLVLGLLTLISVVLAWVKTRIGVWFVLVTGVLASIFALVTAGSNPLLAVLPFGGSLIIGGMLILLGRE
jgi:hypothetical protein